MGSSRRDFLRASLATGAWLGAPTILQREALASYRRESRRADKLNVAVIGCGGKGTSDAAAMKGENVVALCDVDWNQGAKTFQRFEKARKYHDFRVMFDSEKDLDAVVVSTPDHTHAVAAVAAMQRGLHVFCQKPLTHSVEEARVLRELAAHQRVVTQMGNQGMSMEGVRRAAEVVRSGAIGDVRTVHVWTNRPIWPQGIEAPTEIQPIPAAFRWDLWLGPAKHRPWNGAYAHFRWRGWWDFGTGALGDMACHTMNMAYFALELDAPDWVEAETGPFTDASPPKWSIIRYRFPARGGNPPVDLTWYDGGKCPPAELFPASALKDGEVPKYGTLMIGDKGSLFSHDHYGAKFVMWPEEDFHDYEGPQPTIARSPGIHAEWLAGCKGGATPMSNFDRAGRFTEAVLLGNVAIRAGKRIEWDQKAMRVTNDDAANQWVRDEYAYGYSIGT